MFRTRLNARLAIRQGAVLFEASISAFMLSIVFMFSLLLTPHVSLNSNFRSRYSRGTQREFSSKPLKHSIVKRILVFNR